MDGRSDKRVLRFWGSEGSGVLRFGDAAASKQQKRRGQLRLLLSLMGLPPGRPHRPAVRTRPFQGRDSGSIPDGDTTPSRAAQVWHPTSVVRHSAIGATRLGYRARFPMGTPHLLFWNLRPVTDRKQTNRSGFQNFSRQKPILAGKMLSAAGVGGARSTVPRVMKRSS
jgi:hypothetical protein